MKKDFEIHDGINVDDDFIKIYKDHHNLMDYLPVSSRSGENVNEVVNKLIGKIRKKSLFIS